MLLLVLLLVGAEAAKDSVHGGAEEPVEAGVLLEFCGVCSICNTLSRMREVKDTRLLPLAAVKGVPKSTAVLLEEGATAWHSALTPRSVTGRSCMWQPAADQHRESFRAVAVPLLLLLLLLLLLAADWSTRTEFNDRRSCSEVFPATVTASEVEGEEGVLPKASLAPASASVSTSSPLGAAEASVSASAAASPASTALEAACSVPGGSPCPLLLQPTHTSSTASVPRGGKRALTSRGEETRVAAAPAAPPTGEGSSVSCAVREGTGASRLLPGSAVPAGGRARRRQAPTSSPWPERSCVSPARSLMRSTEAGAVLLLLLCCSTLTAPCSSVAQGLPVALTGQPGSSMAPGESRVMLRARKAEEGERGCVGAAGVADSSCTVRQGEVEAPGAATGVWGEARAMALLAGAGAAAAEVSEGLLDRNS